MAVRTDSEIAPFLRDLGARVRMLRREAGLSLDQLAVRTDRSKAGLWEIEKGRNEPGASTLWRLSIALRCSIDYLVKGEEHAESRN